MTNFSRALAFVLAVAGVAATEATPLTAPQSKWNRRTRFTSPLLSRGDNDLVDNVN